MRVGLLHPGEMGAATFAAAGLPSGFHEAAAEMFERAAVVRARPGAESDR